MSAKRASHLAAGIITVAAVVVWPYHPPAAARPAPPLPPQPTQVGRFQMATTAGHVYVLDTATGQVWGTFVSASQGSSDKDFKDPKVTAKR